jgi:hypothetical protein
VGNTNDTAEVIIMRMAGMAMGMQRELDDDEKIGPPFHAKEEQAREGKISPGKIHLATRAELEREKYTGSRRFRFMPIDELYARTGPTEWVVRSYLSKESLAMLFGQSGTLKSFVAIDMGLCVATGTNWHSNPVGQGTVFYICGEGLNGVARRLKAWELHHGINLVGAPFFVSNRPAEFLNSSSGRDVVMSSRELRAQHGDPVLVIIDTLNRNFGPGDESNNQHMTAFIDVVDTYLRRSFLCTVLIVHHTGHTAQDRARGASSLHAALDWEYQAVKDGDILRLTNIKSKDFKTLQPLCFKKAILTLGMEEEDGKPMTSLVLTSTADTVKKDRPLTGPNKVAYDALVECIKNNGGKPVSTETWRAAAYAANISDSEKIDSKRQAFTRAKKDLKRDDMIETKDGLWWATQIPDTGHKADI